MSGTKRVLVTGASGFIGRHVLTPLIERGFEVHATSRCIEIATLQSGIIPHNADLLACGSARALIQMVRPTHLLHLAWTTVPGALYSSLGNLAWVASTLELYRVFIETAGSRALLVGSSAEYDWSYEILREADTPTRPHTLYGAAKNATRQIVEKTGSELGVSTVWARIFFVYGPFEPRGRLVSDVAAALALDEVAKTSEGWQQRDYLHVADVADALAALLDSNLTGTINIASGKAVSVRHIVELLGQLAGRMDLLAFGTRPASAEEPTRLLADIGRLRNELGFTPRYRLEEGLEATWAWWRAAIAAKCQAD
jgi:nucleoside-diphosphate-sugar epimerase